ncbi:MAG: DNA polymerase III subunit alpha [Bacilli bacterium]|nr:DNA polymerase III subunit alpha [Bacilli bacterium]
MNFTPLHVYSGYSYLKSGLKIVDYVKKAKENGFTTIALTDFNSFSGLPHFVNECKAKGIKSIVGADFLIEDYLFTFIVTNEEGYRNLLKINDAYQRKALDINFVKNNNEGLICILGSGNRLIKESFDDKDFAIKFARLSRGISKFYVGLENDGKEYMEDMRSFAYSHGYDVVAFPFVKYVKKEDALILRMLEAIETKEILKEKQFVGDEYSYSLDELKAIYKDEEIALTEKIAESISFEFITKRGAMLHYENSLGLTSDEYLKKVAFESLKQKGLVAKEYIDRFKLEYEVITSMGYSDYFLIVKDFVDYARNAKITVGPGRGSAVGSLISYALGITSCDPIKYNLIFERFLNKERQTLPDIDIDFEDVRREEVVKYIEKKYGKNRVAKIIAIQKFGAKQSLGDVGRIFGYEKRDIELFTKLIGKDDEKLTLRELYKNNKDFRSLVDEDKYYLEIVSLASKLEGLPRQSGMHAAGIVINNGSLKDVIPLTVDYNDENIVQFEKDFLEDQSFLKMDLLSLRNLTIVKDCIARIKESTGISLDIDSLPYEDKKAIDLIASGKTMGIFQLESVGMRKAIKTLKPTEFRDVVALLALFRPGPMENIDVYAARKYKKSKYGYISPVLKDILAPTYGVMVYQEQVMQIANEMAGFSLGEADLLRRAISKKDSKKLVSYEKKFILGAVKNGFKESESKEVYKSIYKFGDYGFNLSHALGYAVLTCRMAYLKAHYPKEFYASILSNSNSENFSNTISEMKALKLCILNPDINVSTDTYLVKGDSIVFPLSSIKGIMSMATNAIMHERANGPFTDFFDFVVRIAKYKFNSKVIMSLIDAGAFDNITRSRASLRLSIPSALNYASMIGDNEGEMLLDMSMFPKPKLAVAKDDKLFDLNKEFDVLGLMISGSPLQLVKNNIRDIKLVNIAEISSTSGNIKVACIFRSIKSIKTKKGKPMAFAMIYDDSGEMEITIFDNVYETYYSALKKNAIVIISGYYLKTKESFSITEINKLEDVNNG